VALYTCERRVAFGECDPARIYFAPRALEYAVEAVELWFEEILRLPWAKLVAEHALEATFERAECGYIRPLLADQVVRMQVAVVTVDPAAAVFRVSGANSSGELCFQATLVACFIDRQTFRRVPIPPRYRDRFAAALAAEGDPGGLSRRGKLPPVDLCPREWHDGLSFVSRRRLAYGECSPAGTFHVPQIFRHAVEAVGEWYRETLGVSWLEQCQRQRGTPFLTIRGEISQRLLPGQTMTFAVKVPRLGKSSIDYAVTGRDDNGRCFFSAQMSACYITEAGGAPVASPFPDELRQRIVAYQLACEAGS
jgi:acyl-CoA thioesterase FadM